MEKSKTFIGDGVRIFIEKTLHSADYASSSIEIDEIEKLFGISENQDDPCSVNKLSIQNNVISIKSSDMGDDNDYNPGLKS